MRDPLLLLFCLILITSSMTGWPETHSDGRVKVIKFGKLVTGAGQIIKNARVVVQDDKITSVSQGDSAMPKGAQVIDLGKLTGIPGLIDVHTHMTYYWDGKPGSDPWRQGGQRMPAVTVFLAQENARKTLETGVTTVRDLGASEYMDIAMRDLINRGAMLGPRMFVSGYGLHSTPRPAPEGTAPQRGRARGAAEVAIAVKQQVDAGADVIKMYGSTGSGQDVTGRQTFTLEEMKAAVDAAHHYGKRIAIHSYGPDGARDAVRAGADSLEHATDMDDDTIKELARGNTFYVPTIDHNRYYAEYHEQFNYPPEAVASLNDYITRNLETARRAFKAGVRFAMGSDAVFNMFGQNTRELAWMVKAGMTPEQALATATTNAAALLGMEKSLGRVAPGYHADIVAVDGDPLSDIDVVINHVKWVMKGGSVVVDRSR
jgi:imidazolonepropionase-like amidohydrolase